MLETSCYSCIDKEEDAYRESLGTIVWSCVDVQREDRKKDKDQWLEPSAQDQEGLKRNSGTSGWSFWDRGGGLEMDSGVRGLCCLVNEEDWR